MKHSDTESKEPKSLKEKAEAHPIVSMASALCAGFLAGFAAYHTILEVSGREPVAKNSYVLKTDVVGNLLRTESLAEIEKLIEVSSGIDADKDKKKAETYLLRVSTSFTT